MSKLSIFDVLASIFWPVTFPAFYYLNSDIIKSVNSNRDWADDNIRPDIQQQFRKEYMPNSLHMGE